MTLKIYLLGQFKLQAESHPIELPSRSAQSLLAYLALNAGVTHRREKLAGLLWPDSTESNARNYLRQALWRLRKALDHASLPSSEYLTISDISLTFNDEADFWLDAQPLLATSEAQPVETLITAASLYRGELLPGFYDEWVILERDRLLAAYQHTMNQLLNLLVKSNRWEETLEWSQNWLHLGHTPEPAFRAMMQAYNGLGDQGMVSATYQRCRDSLERELGVDPAPETQRLYEQILSGELQTSVPAIVPVPVPEAIIQYPAFLLDAEEFLLEQPLFVAREQELEWLQGYLNKALSGSGRIAFITGEAGSGKTALLQELTRRAQECHPDLVVASGNCNAHTGIGDPYLPFREIMQLLTGDVEARWAAGAISKDHAQRLWKILPLSSKALIDVGPDLLDTFISGTSLYERCTQCISKKVGWINRLEEYNQRLTPKRIIPGSGQSDLFEQYTRVLQSLARQFALVLIIDDLQWADLGSISLLFHLGRNLSGCRIFILGAYRPEEVAMGRDGERHPLESVINEFQREFGSIAVNVDRAEGKSFIDALLDNEPNELGPSFREMLYRQTHGHPLFTIELLRGLQERGDLIHNTEQKWIEGPLLNWTTIPARVEAVIGERIERLDKPLRNALRVACVEGEVFTAGVIAQIESSSERELVADLSNELDKKHRLVRAQAIERLDDQRLSRYRFRNFLFQKYLYDDLDGIERTCLHEDIGNVLESLYGKHVGEISVQLAWHFQEAGIWEKAVRYLYQAGERALQLSAYQESIAHLENGLILLAKIPKSKKREELELDLQLTYGIALIGPKGFEPPVKGAFNRARELSQRTGQQTHMCRVLGELAIYHYVMADHQRALELAEEALSLAEVLKNPMLIALEHSYLSFILFAMGNYKAAIDHQQEVIDYYDPEQHHQSVITLRGSDTMLSSYSYKASCLWCLGYPDQAQKLSQEALRMARELNHPFTLADVLCFGCCFLYAMSREENTLIIFADEFLQLTTDRLQGWFGQATWQYGEALALLGNYDDGIRFMQEGAESRKKGYERCFLSSCLRSMAETQMLRGDIEDAMTTLNEAYTFIQESGEHHSEAEIYRTKAEILSTQGNESDAEKNLLKSIDIAKFQDAKSWELRASIDLARLWQKQGRIDEARKLISGVYDWFTEGFDTPDLKNARALLEELEGDKNGEKPIKQA